MPPTISVVIPAYNAARTIRRAVDSALAQSQPPHEVLVVDDGSKDGDALAIALAPLGDNVRLLRKPNGGVASARNFGVERATGDWVAFLDADDEWMPGKLETQADIMRVRPEVAVIGSRWVTLWPDKRHDDGGDAGWCDRVLPPGGSAAWDAAMATWTGTVVARRDALLDTSFRGEFSPAEDRDCWVRLYRRWPAYLVNAPLAVYVQSPDSLSNSDPRRDCLAMMGVVNAHKDLLGPARHAAEVAKCYRRWASVHLARREYRRAVRPAWGRWVRAPFSLEAARILFKSLALGAVSLR